MMQSKQTNRTKCMEKIVSAFTGIEKLPKALLKYGMYGFLGLLAAGCVLVLLSSVFLPYDPYLDLVSKEIVRKSFVLAAEVIIGSLVIDFVFKR